MSKKSKVWLLNPGGKPESVEDLEQEDIDRLIRKISNDNEGGIGMAKNAKSRKNPKPVKASKKWLKKQPYNRLQKMATARDLKGSGTKSELARRLKKQAERYYGKSKKKRSASRKSRKKSKSRKKKSSSKSKSKKKEPVSASKKWLMKQPYNRLQKMATSRGLKGSGTKATLARRLRKQAERAKGGSKKKKSASRKKSYSKKKSKKRKTSKKKKKPTKLSRAKLKKKKYRTLQKMAKERGLKASGSTTDIVGRLRSQSKRYYGKSKKKKSTSRKRKKTSKSKKKGRKSMAKSKKKKKPPIKVGREALKKQSYAHLKHMAAERGLKAKGTKSELMNRLLAQKRRARKTRKKTSKSRAPRKKTSRRGWFGDSAAHRRAALKGWAKRKSGLKPYKSADARSYKYVPNPRRRRSLRGIRRNPGIVATGQQFFGELFTKANLKDMSYLTAGTVGSPILGAFIRKTLNMGGGNALRKASNGLSTILLSAASSMAIGNRAGQYVLFGGISGMLADAMKKAVAPFIAGKNNQGDGGQGEASPEGTADYLTVPPTVGDFATVDEIMDAQTMADMGIH